MDIKKIKIRLKIVIMQPFIVGYYEYYRYVCRTKIINK